MKSTASEPGLTRLDISRVVLNLQLFSSSARDFKLLLTGVVRWDSSPR